MPKYDKIKNELESDLASITPVIAILDDLRSNNRIATLEEESKIINKLNIIHSSDVIALMLESKAQKRNKKLSEQGIDRKYDPISLCSENDIKNFSKYLAGIPENQACHYDIILTPENVHSSALQIHSDGSIARSFFIDSLSNINKDERLQIEGALGAEAHNYIEGKILNADYGCSIFAIQHLNTMNRFLNQTDESFYLEKGYNKFKDLDPIFLKHIQSLDRSDQYEITRQGEKLFINKKHSKTFREHIDDFTVTVTLSDDAGNTTLKKRNLSFLYKLEKYLKEALKTLEEIHSRENGELEKVLANRSGQRIFKNMYHEMGLSPAQIEYVQELYNRDQINLALHCGISADDLKGANCFFTKDMSKTVYKYIFNEPSESRNAAFGKIKDLYNLNQFYAVVQYGLDTNQVQKSKFLKNRLLTNETFQYIQEWHKKSGENCSF